MMSLLQVVNQIEGVIYSDISKHITFWDMQRDFDSIPRKLQKLAWMRMECSREWLSGSFNWTMADCFSSTHYTNTSNLHSYKDMLKEKKHMCGAKNIEELSFKAERKIG
jgi:hypothetical protein